MTNDEVATYATAAIIGIVVLSVGVLVYGLLRAANKPDPALVVTSLSVLTLVSIVAYAATRLEILGGLAATGFGALAGAVTGLYSKHESSDKKTEESSHDESDG